MMGRRWYSTIVLKLKHKLLLFWLGTVVLSLALVGGVFEYLITDLHQETSKKQIGESFDILKARLETRSAVLTRNVELLAKRVDVVASMNMINTYQDIKNYRPIIFDVEKKHLAWELAKQAFVTDLDLVAAFDTKLIPNSFFVFNAKGAARTGFISYRKGKPVPYATDNTQSIFEEAPALSEVLAGVSPGKLPKEPQATVRWVGKELALVVTAVVNRKIVGNRLEPVGTIVAVDVLGDEFVRSVSNLAGMEFMYTAGGRRVGALKSVSSDSILGTPPSLKDIATGSSSSWWVPHSEYYLGAGRKTLLDGSAVTFVFGHRRGQLLSEIGAFETAVFWVIILTALLVVPGGLYFANRTITAPVENLMQGVAELRDGRYSKISGFNSHDELHELAESFNDMAETIQNRETELTELNAELDRRVTQRTDELAMANQELEAFAYSVSHDLRAPLRSVDGFSHILTTSNGDNLDERGQWCLNRIQNGIRRMGDLIDDLLTLSRSTRGEMERREISLTQIANRTIEKLREGDVSRRISIEIEPGLSGYGDPRLIGVVLDNLLGNAWKYTGKTEDPRISFGCCKEGDNAGAYFIEDNGVGFDMKYAEKLFAPFQRLHGVDEFEGNGIGLATVQRIVGRHGGKVWVNSKIGEGTSLYFTLGIGA